MKLEIKKQLPYISPSAYMAWENCEYFHYLRKLAGLKFPRQPQSDAAAVGTVFDICVKSYMAKQLGEVIDREKLWKNLEITSSQSGVIKAGIELWKLYYKSEAFHRMKTMVTSVDLKCETEHNGIPIFGYPDAQTRIDPFDWKTSGYNATYTRSPNPGYSICYNLSEGGVWKTMHKRCGEPLDKLNYAWAVQCLFYSWMLDVPTPGGVIHQLIFQPNRILCAVLDARISDECIEKTEKGIARMWEQSLSGDFDYPTPGDRICKSYGQWCEAACHCDYHMEWLKDGF